MSSSVIRSVLALLFLGLLILGASRSNANTLDPLVPALAATAHRPDAEVARFLNAVKDTARSEDEALTLLAVAWKESTFRANAKSRRGDGIGGFQVNPKVHKVRNLSSLSVNAKTAHRILVSYGLGRDPLRLVLLRYNRGPAKAQKFYRTGSSDSYTTAVFRYRFMMLRTLDKRGSS